MAASFIVSTSPPLASSAINRSPPQEALYLRCQAQGADNFESALTDCVAARKVLKDLPEGSAPALEGYLKRARKSLRALKKESFNQEASLYANAFGGPARRRG